MQYNINNTLVGGWKFQSSVYCPPDHDLQPLNIIICVDVAASQQLRVVIVAHSLTAHPVLVSNSYVGHSVPRTYSFPLRIVESNVQIKPLQQFVQQPVQRPILQPIQQPVQRPTQECA